MDKTHELVLVAILEPDCMLAGLGLALRCVVHTADKRSVELRKLEYQDMQVPAGELGLPDNFAVAIGSFVLADRMVDN